MRNGVDPRWGNQGRDRKAQAIWLTLRERCGAEIADGCWLDVGCGSGGIAATLAPHVRSITGVDPEPWDAWEQQAAAHPNLTFLVGEFDGDRPSIPESSMDVTICNQVYEHVSNHEALIGNIYRVLRPGGVCYFAGPNLLWPIEPHVFWPVVHWLPRTWAHNLMRGLGSRRADELDAYSRSYWTLKSWFTKAGFEARSNISGRLRAELEIRKHASAARLASTIPPGILAPLVPFSPGFVFILRK